MFQKMKNIDTAFRYIRAYTIIVIISCVLLSSYALYKSFALAKLSESKVYILAGGKVLEAYASERKDNTEVEARDHVKTFHHYFFSLHPDEKVIERNLSRALYLADGTAKGQYDNLKENGYYASVISGNISQEVEVDSVLVNINSYPYHFRCYATQTIIRPTTITKRSLTTEGRLRSVSRSDNNPHGFLVERWQVVENRDLKTVNR